ncbi:efflux RND transporter periplasmic adaptor subunit [bacterium]|nr:efflux RND transporter periplasmic adaptor subunit [candidate division CSSED10-310 bacterium]
MNTDSIRNPESHHLTPREKTLLAAVTLGIIAGTVMLTLFLLNNRPTARRQPPPKSAPAVVAASVRASDRQVTLDIMGTISPDVEITLAPEISGEIIAVHPEFIPGGTVSAGETLVTINPLDYETAVAQAEASLEQARLELRQEEGQQIIAEKEWRLMGGRNATALEMELALRKPQLRKAQASLRSAEAQLRRARSDLDKTRVKAPFNAVIRSVSVHAGDQATPQKTLAKLVGTDAYRVMATLPVDRIPWIEFPSEFNPDAGYARIHTVSGIERDGRLKRLLSDIEPNGRMARVLITIDDPLGLNDSSDTRVPLLLDEYVHVSLAGKHVQNIIEIPRETLRDNDTVWILSPENTLDIVPVEIVWKDTRTVLIRGIDSGARLIVSDLPGPVQGMNLTLNELTELRPDESAGQTPAHQSPEDIRREGRPEI